jgi:hypothetical protein
MSPGYALHSNIRKMKVPPSIWKMLNADRSETYPFLR